MKSILFISLFLISGCNVNNTRNVQNKTEPQMHISEIRIETRDNPEFVIAKDKNLVKEFENQINHSRKAYDVIVFGYTYIAYVNIADSTKKNYETMYIGKDSYRLNGTLYRTEGDLGAICEKIMNSK